MRISLLYNADAGDGVSARELRREIERAGYEVVQIVEKDSDFKRALEKPADLIAVAGGDGTVRKASRALAGCGAPLAILPLGTANNIARSLGIEGSTSRLIQGWGAARRLSFDLGVARGGWGQSRFLEGVGGGLIPSGIAAQKGKPSPEREKDADSKLARAVRTYRDVLSRLEPRPWTMTVDGARRDGPFLLLEVLNIASVGPNLVLSPDADPSDQLFDVVTAGEEEREELASYLLTRIEGREGRLALPTLRAREVEIQGWEEMHLDDEVRTGPSVATVSIRIETAALQFLV